MIVRWNELSPDIIAVCLNNVGHIIGLFEPDAQCVHYDDDGQLVLNSVRALIHPKELSVVTTDDDFRNWKESLQFRPGYKGLPERKPDWEESLQKRPFTMTDAEVIADLRKQLAERDAQIAKLQTRVEEDSVRVDWSAINPEHDYVAMDKAFKWFSFPEEPVIEDEDSEVWDIETWDIDQPEDITYSGAVEYTKPIDWRKTLRKRPGVQ